MLVEGSMMQNYSKQENGQNGKIESFAINHLLIYLYPCWITLQCLLFSHKMNLGKERSGRCYGNHLQDGILVQVYMEICTHIFIQIKDIFTLN